MNCRRAQQLISSYIDSQLTGRQMLEIQQHIQECPECIREYLALRQVKTLVRALGEQNPDSHLPTRITAHLDREGIASSSSFSVMQRPPCGRRLATALALSCIGILAVAVPFAPSTADVNAPADIVPPPAAYLVLTASPMEEHPITLVSPGSAFVTDVTRQAPRRLSVGNSRRGAGGAPQEAQPTLQEVAAGPLNEEAVQGYAQGDATLVDFKIR